MGPALDFWVFQCYRLFTCFYTTHLLWACFRSWHQIISQRLGAHVYTSVSLMIADPLISLLLKAPPLLSTVRIELQDNRGFAKLRSLIIDLHKHPINFGCCLTLISQTDFLQMKIRKIRNPRIMFKPPIIRRKIWKENYK